MKILRDPAGITAPEYESDIDRYLDECESYILRIMEYARKNGSGKYAGMVVSFPYADGLANYVVFDRNTIIHLSDGDAYEFPHIERLTPKDVERRIESQIKFKAFVNKIQEGK